MATPTEKLALSLDALKRLQERGAGAIRTQDLGRTHRALLQKNGFLRLVMKGWYIPSRPDETAGESTAWIASFWSFVAAYLQVRFDGDWCLSPEQSLSLQAGNQAVPRQLVVRSPKARNRATALPHDTSLLDIRASVPGGRDVVIRDALRLYTVPAALIAAAPGYFRHNAVDARAALASIRDASELLARLLDGGHSTIAGRLAGAFRNIGRDRIADDLLDAMRAAGYDVREEDPFDGGTVAALPAREASPYASRLRLMWQAMRAIVVDGFPSPSRRRGSADSYLRLVRDAYVADAYHSLSIEGYRVSPTLIERVRGGRWNPDLEGRDRDHRDALAARGYWQASQAVEQSLRRVLRGDNPGVVADQDHGSWYREMFAPAVTAGLLRPVDLAGYRDGPVSIRRSRHVPPRAEAVRDAMPVLFDMLATEVEPAVRVVLGDFMFVYVHPYMDGNGRMGRFLMNVMLAAGGYPWTVVPLQRREAYMDALEQASVHQDIAPFTAFLARLVDEAQRGEIAAVLPRS